MQRRHAYPLEPLRQLRALCAEAALQRLARVQQELAQAREALAAAQAEALSQSARAQAAWGRVADPVGRLALIGWLMQSGQRETALREQVTVLEVQRASAREEAQRCHQQLEMLERDRDQARAAFVRATQVAQQVAADQDWIARTGRVPS